MSKELVIGSNRHETKVAILEDDQLVEVYFQRGNEYSLAGSIHKGRVTRVLPGMQSAFVDLGLERDTFLYVSDFFEENEDIDTVSDDVPVKSERRDQRRGGERNTGERQDRNAGERGERNQGHRNQVERPAELPASDDAGAFATKVRAIDAGGSAFDREDEAEAAGGPVEQPLAGNEGERSEGDSQRGDRGNRRGRRRRPRGRGFPENKYAQPSSVSSFSESSAERSPVAEEASAERTRPDRLPGEKIGGDRPSFDRAYADRSSLDRVPAAERFRGDRPPRAESMTAASEDVEPSDVIILPGESLAKYRKTPAAAPSALEPERPVDHETAAPFAPVERFPVEERVEEPVAEVPVSDEDEIPVEDLLAEQEAISSEAEELELADRIFAHHEAQELPEDEKLADVEIERIEPAKLHEETHYEAAHPEVPDPEEAPEHAPDGEPVAFRTHEEFSLPFEATSTVDIVGPIVIEAEPLATYGATAPLGLGAEGESEGEEFEEGEGVSEAGDEISGEARVSETPQTANLRDPSGRSMHRSSRRSRRRRGGNRFGSSTDATGVSAGPVPALGLATASASAGAAPALEPVEIRREAQETRPERAERVVPSIADLLKAGQEIIVQIAKEPLGQKGARITSHIALPGRYVVFMPSVSHLGVSRKVASDDERQRLKQILQKHRTGTSGGFIVRTAGEGVPEDEIAADMNFLYNLWLDIRQKAEKKPAPMLLHYDLDIVQRILRDHVTDDYKAIWVDSEDMYESVLTFMQRFQPTLVSRVKMYTREAPIFDAFNITQELEKALRPKVWLKSGGYIVINQTEALVAIDINTGKYVGKSNRLEDTIVKTNTEAVKEIVRQIRLRDLGGIIVVDFIDMDERKNRQKVMAALEEAMESDKAPYKILQFNDFGLVAITRKRVKQSLERTLCAPCPYCEGAGYVKSVQTTIGEILVEAQKLSRAIDGKDVVLRVHPEVAKVLKASNNKYLEEIEEILKRPVLVAGDATLHTEKFDLA